MSQTQYADLIKRHLRAETWYQLGISLYDDKFNPFRCYIPHMVGGCVNLLRECLLKLLSNVRKKCIQNPSIIKLSKVPNTLFDTEWLFRCCVSLRNDRHGAVPQGLLPRLFQSILKEYCNIYANHKNLPIKSRSIRWLVSEWSIYQYIVDRLAMLTSKIDVTLLHTALRASHQDRFNKTIDVLRKRSCQTTIFTQKRAKADE